MAALWIIIIQWNAHGGGKEGERRASSSRTMPTGNGRDEEWILK